MNLDEIAWNEPAVVETQNDLCGRDNSPCVDLLRYCTLRLGVGGALWRD